MNPLIIAQISDLHVKRQAQLSYGVVDTTAMPFELAEEPD